MRRFLKPVLLRLGTLALIGLAPIVWCAWGRHGYFIGERYWGGVVYHSYWYFKGDRLYAFRPGEDFWGYPIYRVRATADGWDALDVNPAKGDQVRTHFRLQGGDLVDTSVQPKIFGRHERCYNVWKVWYEWFFAENPRQPQQITCVNNLKQIGLSVRLWADDHGDDYPFNISTNQGGTLEWRDMDAAGWDTNSWRHFLVMSNEFYKPAVLACPQDRNRKPAADWAKVGAGNVSYYFRANVSTNDSGTEILAVCPVDGNVLYVDGHVEEKVIKKFKP